MNKDELKQAARRAHCGLPIILRSGGAGGKGVIVAHSYDDVDKAIDFLCELNGEDSVTMEPWEEE